MGWLACAFGGGERGGTEVAQRWLGFRTRFTLSKREPPPKGGSQETIDRCWWCSQGCFVRSFAPSFLQFLLNFRWTPFFFCIFPNKHDVWMDGGSRGHSPHTDIRSPGSIFRCLQLLLGMDGWWRFRTGSVHAVQQSPTNTTANDNPTQPTHQRTNQPSKQRTERRQRETLYRRPTRDAGVAGATRRDSTLPNKPTRVGPMECTDDVCTRVVGQRRAERPSERQPEWPFL